MATNFPAGLDDLTSLPNPTASSATNSPSHAGLHDNENDSIRAIETKLGTGASTPAAGQVLKASGTGTSQWAGLAEADVTNLVTDLAAKATDTAVVHLAGAETVTGAKTFNAGTLLDKGNQVFNVKSYGAKGDTQLVIDGAMTAASAVLTSNAGKFTAADVGKVVTVIGAGAAGARLNTTIQTYTSATSVTLAATATTAVTNATVVWGTDDVTAIRNAITAASPGGIVYFPIGNYGVSNNLLISPTASATRSTIVPSLIAETVPGRIGDVGTSSFADEVSAVSLYPLGAYPQGTLMIDYVSADPGGVQSLNGAAIRGLDLICLNIAAGMRLSNTRRFRVSNINIDHAAVPTGYTDTNVTGAFNVVQQSGTATAYGYYENISISYSAKDGFVHNAAAADVFMACWDLNAANYAYVAMGFARFMACHYEASKYGWKVIGGNQPIIIVACEFFGTPTSNALQVGSNGNGFPVKFVACNFQNNPAASPTEEAGAIIDVITNNGFPMAAQFINCDFNVGTNTTDFVYVQPGVAAGSKVKFTACTFRGTPKTSLFNDTSGNNVLEFWQCDGIANSAVGKLTTLANAGFGTTSPAFGIHQLGGGQRLQALATPTAPVVTVTGTAGTTSYSYYIVANDRNGGKTLVSPVTTVATGNATLSGTNYNAISWTAVPAAVSYDVLKGSTGTSLALGVTTTSLNDTGQATAAYTAPTRNATADSTIDGNLTVGPTSGANFTLADLTFTKASGSFLNVNGSGVTNIGQLIVGNSNTDVSKALMVSPNTDSTTSSQFLNAARTGVIMSVDTTNQRVGFSGNTAPGARVDIGSNADVGTVSPLRVLGYSNTQALQEWGDGSGAVYLRVFRSSGNVMSLTSSSILGLPSVSVNGFVQVAGSISTAFAAKTAAYTLTNVDSIISVDATAAAFTVTLPDATTCTGRQYTVKKVDASANNVTIATTPNTQTIDGVTTKVVSGQWTVVKVVSNGTNWLLV